MKLESLPIGGEWRDGRHLMPIRVYYEDTDFTGVVYHASYLRFLERGRTEFLRAAGISHGELHAAEPDARLAFVVRRMAIDFLRPARIDDLVVVETTPGEIGGASVTLIQRLSREENVLVTAEVKVAIAGQGRAQRLPPELREKLIAHTRLP